MSMVQDLCAYWCNLQACNCCRVALADLNNLNSLRTVPWANKNLSGEFVLTLNDQHSTFISESQEFEF